MINSVAIRNSIDTDDIKKGIYITLSTALSYLVPKTKARKARDLAESIAKRYASTVEDFIFSNTGQTIDLDVLPSTRLRKEEENIYGTTEIIVASINMLFEDDEVEGKYNISNEARLRIIKIKKPICVLIIKILRVLIEQKSTYKYKRSMVYALETIRKIIYSQYDNPDSGENSNNKKNTPVITEIDVDDF